MSAKARSYTIHLLVYGRSFTAKRVNLILQRPCPSTIRLLRYDPSPPPTSSSNVDGPNHVLVVDSKFIAGGDTASLPAEVWAAVKAVLRKDGRVCTDQWLERFQAGGWREGVSAGFMREDVTDIYRKKFGIPVKRSEKTNGDDDSVIDLQSSGESESDDDEVEVLAVKQPSQPSKRLKADSSEADADVKPATMTERQREMAERKRNRPANLRERPAFAATWLRNADGFKEAKVKANTLHTTYPKGESPEEIVLAKATAYMERVKSRSKKQWNFVFEACYQEQCKAKAASGEGGEETIGQQALEVNESSTDANSSSHFDVRARNIQIGKRIRDIFTAETVLDELERIRMGRKADKTQRATRDFRKIEYQRVARTVETYPIPGESSYPTACLQVLFAGKGSFHNPPYHCSIFFM